MIFSTFYRAKLFANNKQCFIVNPIMTPNEKNILIQKVHLLVNRRNALSLSSVINVVQKYVSDKNILDDIYNDLNITVNHSHNIMSNDKKVGLLDVINSDMLQLNVNANLPKEVIEIASRPLIDKNIITKSYVQKV